MLKGDRLALARLMSIVEDRLDSVSAIMREIYPLTGRAYRIGITGPPGAGKSTVIDKLIGITRGRRKRVGVIAVDPSSPFTGGAVLGDRIRMQSHSLDEGVFIRSLGTRGSHGGLSQSTRDAVSLLDAFGNDCIIIETVGVGQTELNIASQADTTVVVLVPESGDTIQAMKAGLMEIADIFVVNKGDREGAEEVAEELREIAEESAHEGDGWKTPVFITHATEGSGINELYDAIFMHKEYLDKNGIGEVRRKEGRKREFVELVVEEVKKTINVLESKGKLSKYLKRVENGTMSPHVAALNVLKRVKPS